MFKWYIVIITFLNNEYYSWSDQMDVSHKKYCCIFKYVLWPDDFSKTTHAFLLIIGKLILMKTCETVHI